MGKEVAALQTTINKVGVKVCEEREGKNDQDCQLQSLYIQFSPLEDNHNLQDNASMRLNLVW